ncbi:hypothetical protein ES703_120986 [subsurface metagenome]
MDRLAELLVSLSRLSLAELRLVLRFAEWLKGHTGELAH